jgi:DNA-binding NtrC family response regulator
VAGRSAPGGIRVNGPNGAHGAAGSNGSNGSNGHDPFLRDDGHVKRLLEIEAEAISRALSMYRGRMSETARRLGIGRSTLYRKIDELRIEKKA